MVGRKTRFGSTGVGLAVVLLCGAVTRPAMAVSMDEAPMDKLTLQQLEQRAEHAEAKEQCFLYAQVLHGLTELAGRQMAAGLDDEASATMLQVDAVAAKVEKTSAGDAKRLKNAEMILEHTSHRLADMVRVASSEERSVMQTTLKHLDAVHSSVLALVFSR